MVEASGRDKPPPDPDDAWRIKGLRDLDRRELAFVREIWHWREREARKADLPPFKIMGNPLIVKLAIRAISHPRSPLREGPKLPRHITGRRFKALGEVIEDARALPEADWPEPRRPRPWARNEPRIAPLRAECARIAGELGIAPAVLAPRAALEAIARKCPRTVDEIMACSSLLRWQTGLIESAIRHFLDTHETASEEPTPDAS